MSKAKPSKRKPSPLTKGKKPPAKKKVAEPAQVTSSLVNDYVASLTGWHQKVVVALRKLIRSADKGIEERVKWGWPCYIWQGKIICGIMQTRESINFVLYRGAELNDPDFLIEGSGKAMRHVKLRALQDLKRKQFLSFIHQTIELVK